MTNVIDIHGDNKLEKNQRFLCFSLGDESFGVPLTVVREVIAIPEMTPVPFAASYFLGIINLRGQILSVIDFRKKLNIKGKETEEKAIIICECDELCLGAVVDSIDAVVTPTQGELSENPHFSHGSLDESYITGVYRHDNKLILFIDPVKTLNVDDRAFLNRKTFAAAA